MDTRKSLVVAVLISAILTIAIVGSMIILDEVDSGFKAFLNQLTGHHWLTKSVFTAVLFPLFSIVFILLFRSERARKALQADNVWGWTLLLVAVTVFFYVSNFINYLLHYFGI